MKMSKNKKGITGTDYRSVMPTNLYGPGDNYHPENSHVIPALLRRFHEAKNAGAEKVVVWGTGTPRREFLYVEDMAEASVHVMELERAVYDAHTTPTSSHINVGTGEEVTIRELAELLGKVTGFQGIVEFDAGKPDGTPRKLISNDRLSRLGWRRKMALEEGLAITYSHYVNSLKKTD
jgi:GDP-L-fucose synthase